MTLAVSGRSRCSRKTLLLTVHPPLVTWGQDQKGSGHSLEEEEEEEGEEGRRRGEGGRGRRRRGRRRRKRSSPFLATPVSRSSIHGNIIHNYANFI